MNFDKLTRFFDSITNEYNVPSVAVSVWQNHEQLYRRAAGYQDKARTVPTGPEHYYWVFSNSKIVTCTAVMQMVEQGKIGLDVPVSEYLPAWKNAVVRDGDTVRPPKTPVTVRHMLSMQSGMNYDLNTPPVRALRDSNPNVTTRQIADALALSPLGFDPGEHYAYSLSHDILGAVVEAVSGMRFGDYVQKYIFEPCGMSTATYHPTQEQMQKMIYQYVFKDGQLTDHIQVNSYCFSPEYESGGAGIFCRVDDFIRFADAMACGGISCEGRQIICPETINIMRTNQLGPKSLAEFKAATTGDYGYGCGVRTLLDNSKGSRSSVGEFGWDGAAASYTLIDPAKKLSLFLALQVQGFARGKELHHAVRDMVYECMGY